MCVPKLRRASKLYVAQEPNCAQRQRARALFQDDKAKAWVCTSIVTWALAFPGGLNGDPRLQDPGCTEPHWIIRNMQPHPKQLLSMPIWGERAHLRCVGGQPSFGTKYTTVRGVERNQIAERGRELLQAALEGRSGIPSESSGESSGRPPMPPSSDEEDSPMSPYPYITAT
jgi:hypothetical protein